MTCRKSIVANEDEAVLREYGFGVAIALMLLLLFVINVIGALIGFVVLWFRIVVVARMGATINA